MGWRGGRWEWRGRGERQRVGEVCMCVGGGGVDGGRKREQCPRVSSAEPFYFSPSRTWAFDQHTDQRNGSGQRDDCWRSYHYVDRGPALLPKSCI